MISPWLYALAALSAVVVYYLIRFNIALANQKKAEAEMKRQRAEMAQIALEQKRLETIAIKTAELNAQATRKQEQKEADSGNRGHLGEW
jgi:hypothetical protein